MSPMCQEETFRARSISRAAPQSVIWPPTDLRLSTLTPILKKRESIGYIRRQSDPADERQVRVSLMPAGRQLLDTDPGASLVEATGLGKDFPEAQKTMARIRDNLLRATRA
jgi:DNA-binding MarR family transcriptional regulator